MASITKPTQISPDLEQAIRDRVAEIPIIKTLNVQLTEFGLGTCTIVIPYKTDYNGIYESFHGGLLGAAADTVACFAVMTITGPEQMMTTTDFNIRFLAPCLGDLRAEAQTIKVGKSLCPVSVNLYCTKTNKLCAVAQVTYMRLDKIPAR